MRKQKWSDFFGAVCATATVALVAASAKHVQRKYGVRNASTLMDYKKIANYAFEKLILDNDKLPEIVGAKLAVAKAEETEKTI
ncbi:MAG: hypothetical protein MR290_02055 [Ruminococcus sp.]|nr:hypothetical protein [Ruminococcus sp.]